MSDITINYKGSSIATMDASGTKTLLTEGKYCEDDIDIVYVQPSGGSNVQSGTVTGNGGRDITIAVTGTVSKFVIYSSDYSGGSNYQNATLTAVSGWGFWGLALNGTTPSRLLYSLESGYSTQKYVTFSNGSVKLSPYYTGSGYQVWGTGITYQWYAW